MSCVGILCKICIRALHKSTPLGDEPTKNERKDFSLRYKSHGVRRGRMKCRSEVRFKSELERAGSGQVKHIYAMIDMNTSLQVIGAVILGSAYLGKNTSSLAPLKQFMVKVLSKNTEHGIWGMTSC